MTQIVFNSKKVEQWVAASVGSTDCSAAASFGVERDGEILCGVIYDNFNGANIFIHLSAVPGYQFTKGFLRLVFGYAFDCLKVKRITGVFSSANEKVKRFGERLGFKFEAVLKDASKDGDLLLYVLRREWCRVLKGGA